MVFRWITCSKHSTQTLIDVHRFLLVTIPKPTFPSVTPQHKMTLWRWRTRSLYNNDLHSPSANLHIKEYNRNLERSLYTLVLSIKLINFHFEWYTEFHSLTKTHKINTLTFHKESQGQTHNPLSTKHYRIKTLSTEFHHKSKYIMEATRSQTKMFTLHLPCKHRTKYSSSQWRVVTC